MAAIKHPCGCIFDEDFVDAVHHDDGQSHTPKAAPKADKAPPEEKAEAKEEGPSAKVPLLEKAVSVAKAMASKGKKASPEDE